MKVAVLVVTNRPEHIAWWKHQIKKQTRQPDEVIVVDNRPDLTVPWIAGGCQGLLGGGWFAQHVDPRTTLGEMRQFALNLATADIILWFDDDDWYHPRRVELSAGFIESGRYDVVAFPLTHFYYLKEEITRPFPHGTAVHLPATAWRREISRQVRFESVNTGEDHFWIHTQVHPLDGSTPLVPASRIRWISEYGEPHFGGMVTVHAKNSWQTPLAHLTLQGIDRYEGRPLPTYAPKDVSQDAWDEDRRLLAAMRAAHYGDK
jgi:hypothetical protein